MVSISDVSSLEETATTVGLNATDIDGDTDFTFSASTSSDLFDLSVSGSTLTITPGENQVGTGSIAVSVSDGGLSSDNVTFDVVIENVNDAPVLSYIETPDSALEDGDDIVVTLSASDVDGDDVSFTANTSNSDLFESVIIDGNTITLNPADNASGSSTVNIFASDGSATVAGEFYVDILAVNDAPTLASLSDIAAGLSLVPPIKPSTFGASLTKCHVSSFISILTKT